ncbi:MAG: hypothetical protein AAGD38_06845 [Acidobacteriota bacterium]
MDRLPVPGNSIEDYFEFAEWELRLDRTMDRIEDRLFDYPRIALDWSQRLDPLFARRPESVTATHRIRAAALRATASSLCGALETSCADMTTIVGRARELGNDLPEDIGGWIHAKYAVMLIKLGHIDVAHEVIAAGLDSLTSKSEPVKAVTAQLYLARGRIHRHERDWQRAFDWCKKAYDLATHRRSREGGYYRRGDVTRAAAVLNLVQLAQLLSGDPQHCLRMLTEQCKFRVYRSIRSNWGFAPYHEIATTHIFGRLQAKAGNVRAAIDNLEFSARAYLRSSCPLEALETSIDLAALAPEHPSITRVIETIFRQSMLSPRLAEYVATRKRNQIAEDSELLALIAEERRRRHLPQAA